MFICSVVGKKICSHSINNAYVDVSILKGRTSNRYKRELKSYIIKHSLEVMSMVPFSFNFMNSRSVWSNYESMQNSNENNGIEGENTKQTVHMQFFFVLLFLSSLQHSLAPTKHNTTQLKIHRSLLCMYCSYFFASFAHTPHAFTVSCSESVDWHWKFVAKCHFTAYTMFDVAVCVCVFVVCWRNFVHVPSSEAFHISRFIDINNKAAAWERKRRRKRKGQNSNRHTNWIIQAWRHTLQLYTFICGDANISKNAFMLILSFDLFCFVSFCFYLFLLYSSFIT